MRPVLHEGSKLVGCCASPDLPMAREATVRSDKNDRHSISRGFDAIDPPRDFVIVPNDVADSQRGAPSARLVSASMG